MGAVERSPKADSGVMKFPEPLLAKEFPRQETKSLLTLLLIASLPEFSARSPCRISHQEIKVHPVGLTVLRTSPCASSSTA